MAAPSTGDIARGERAPDCQDVRIGELDYRLYGWGNGEGEAVWLLHGWGDTGLSFQFLADALLAESPEPLRIMAPDWRGFGASGRPRGRYWFPDYLADLDALLGHFDPGGAVTLVGHSMGGNIAGLYAGIRPDRIRHLVSLEGFGLAPRDASEAPDHLALWLDQVSAPPDLRRFNSEAALVAYLQRRMPEADAARARFIARAWADAGDDGRWTLKMDPRHKLVNPVLYRREEAVACWRRTTADVLLVSGGASPFGENALKQGLDALLADCFGAYRHLNIGGAGHMLHIEHPEVIAEATLALMAGRDHPGVAVVSAE